MLALLCTFFTESHLCLFFDPPHTAKTGDNLTQKFQIWIHPSIQPVGTDTDFQSSSSVTANDGNSGHKRPV